MAMWPERLDENRLRMHESLSFAVVMHVQLVVEFAKRIPDFSNLSQPDQLVLIKKSFVEVWVTQAAHCISTAASSFMLSDGRIISKQELDFVFSVSCPTTWLSLALFFVCL